MDDNDLVLRKTRENFVKLCVGYKFMAVLYVIRSYIIKLLMSLLEQFCKCRFHCIPHEESKLYNCRLVDVGCT